MGRFIEVKYMGFRTLEISRAAEIHIKEGQLEITTEVFMRIVQKRKASEKHYRRIKEWALQIVYCLTEIEEVYNEETNYRNGEEFSESVERLGNQEGEGYGNNPYARLDKGSTRDARILENESTKRTTSDAEIQRIDNRINSTNETSSKNGVFF